jgi:hypothetical protein
MIARAKNARPPAQHKPKNIAPAKLKKSCEEKTRETRTTLMNVANNSSTLEMANQMGLILTPN